MSAGKNIATVNFQDGIVTLKARGRWGIVFPVSRGTSLALDGGYKGFRRRYIDQDLKPLDWGSDAYLRKVYEIVGEVLLEQILCVSSPATKMCVGARLGNYREIIAKSGSMILWDRTRVGTKWPLGMSIKMVCLLRVLWETAYGKYKFCPLLTPRHSLRLSIKAIEKWPQSCRVQMRITCQEFLSV